MSDPPLSILSYHGLDVIRLLCVEDLKLHLLQTGGLTDGEYENICQPDILRRGRLAAEKVWEALKTKPDGFQRLVKALEANVAEASYNSGHEELLNILKGPDFEFEKLKSLVGTHLSDKMCLDVVRFLLKVKVSEGHSLIHSSVLQGCNTWRKLFQQLERCRLCHALDTDLLSHAIECVDGDVTNLRPILQRLAKFKSSEYPVQEKAGLVVPLPGFFLMAVHTLDSGLQMKSRLRQLKDTLSEGLAVTKPLFQYLSTVQGVHYYQFPLRYLDIFPEYLQSGKVDRLSRSRITHITIRSDSQMMEFDLSSASMDTMSSTYIVAYSPVIDQMAASRVSSSRHVTDDMSLAVPRLECPSSPVLQKAASTKSPTADKDPLEKPESGHTRSCVADLSPGMHRRSQPVRSSVTWSSPNQRRSCAKRVHTLKLFLVGPKSSGKSTFLQSYMGGRQCMQQQTGVDVKDKVISWNHYSDIRINVWDMPGTDFDQPTKDWAKTPVYREADGFIFVADMFRFDESLVQIKDLRKKASGVPALESRIPMVIVVNKCDGAHASGPNEGQVKLLKQFIQAHKFAHYFTTSAKMDIGVQRVFEYVAARVLNSESEHIQSMLHLEQQ